MRGLFCVTVDQAQSFISPTDWPHILHFAKFADPLYAGLWDSKLVCLVGLIPQTLLSDRAYIWLHDTPLAQEHKLLVGRYAKRLISHWRQIYRLEGHCLTPQSWRWLKSLGAVETSSTTFEIV